MKKWIIPFLFLSSAWTTNVYAQTKQLSLQDALRFALDHNQQLAVSRIEEQIGKQKHRKSAHRRSPAQRHR